MREKLSEMSEIVQENIVKQQKRQKRWYDHGARLREFKGDPVLVMLPTSSNKLRASLTGREARVSM